IRGDAAQAPDAAPALGPAPANLAALSALRPAARPGERPSPPAVVAVPAAASPPPPSPGAIALAAPEVIEDDGEPEAAAVRSSPTPASVAELATEESVLPRRELALIGVFGTSSSRRALVRLAGGRMVQVQVGDRLDGGQVAAIDTTRLIYVKNGRNQVLDLAGG
ncbi:MAG: hypothetical protein H5U20_02645, partial [Rhodobacteraceae bacterium]|nr:hypothetical protein [Paracoccaceae bacterium]